MELRCHKRYFKKRYWSIEPIGCRSCLEDTLCGSNKGLFLRQKVQLKNELGGNIGAKTEKLCWSKKFPGSSLIYGLRRGAEMWC